ncbi:MAG: hypothetical protein IT306_12520 [Chloroflexi bacterium]|nr:hypothetical protein [Chloroflexota bacterium]
MTDKRRPRAAYLGEQPPPYYRKLNGERFALPTEDDAATGMRRRLNRGLGAVDRSAFLAHANADGLDHMVKVVPLPLRIPRALSQAVIREMAALRQAEVLTVLRGGRRTDLARPLSPEQRAHVRTHAPNLIDVIRRIEAALVDGDLFLRTVKYDDARYSSTHQTDNLGGENYHFDAQEATLDQWSGVIHQYFANVATLPRQFRILPVTLPEMIERLVQDGHLAREAARTTKIRTILETFRARYDEPVEQIIVESGQLAIFDGRLWAHDAGKGRLRDLVAGRFVPSREPDLVITLDSKKTGFHEGMYDPSQPFLDDPGHPSYWERMTKLA